MDSSSRFTGSFLLMVCTVSSGCNHKAAGPPPVAKLSPGSGSAVFNKTTAFYELMRGKVGPKVVIWTDNTYGTIGGSYWAIAEDGSRLEWTIRSDDGKEGHVVINGQNYDLAKGNVFLVSTREFPIKLAQLKRDLLADDKLTAGAVLATLAEKDADISKFIATASAQK